ncbi:MAG TPA: hypothetical protein VF097_07595 [Actinomycetota bacterium]
MLRCPVCNSIRVVMVLKGESRAFCARCGARWVQNGGRQTDVRRGDTPADHPA